MSGWAYTYRSVQAFLYCVSVFGTMSDPAYEAIKKARRQEEGNNPEGAVKTLEDYLATDPHCIPPRMELARIYTYKTNQRKYGIVQLQVILELEPDNIDALKALTTVLMLDKHNNADVDAMYTRLIPLVAAKNDPKEFAAVCTAYAVFLRKQMLQFNKAAEYYEKALTSCPDKYEYHLDYAVLLLNDLKDYAKAKEELELLMEMNPNNYSVKTNYDKLMRTRFDRDGNVKKTLRDRIFRH